MFRQPRQQVPALAMRVDAEIEGGIDRGAVHRLAQQRGRAEREQGAQPARCLGADEPDHRHRRGTLARAEAAQRIAAEIAIHEDDVTLRRERGDPFREQRIVCPSLRDLQAEPFERHREIAGRAAGGGDDQRLEAAEILDQPRPAHDTTRSAAGAGS